MTRKPHALPTVSRKMSGWYSKKGSRSQKGKGRSFFNSDGGDLFAPTSAQPNESAKKELKNVPPVREDDHFHSKFLAVYPDGDGSCIRDYGKKVERLSADEIHRWTSAQNCEWKRRPAYACSFTAASVRSLVALTDDIPEGLDDILPENDQSSVFRSLSFLRRVLQTSDGKQFVEACNVLDVSNEIQRAQSEVRKHIAVMLKFLCTNDDFFTAMQLLLSHGAKLFTCASWGLLGGTMPKDMQRWADGFPASQDVRNLYTEEVRAWLRDPSDLNACVDAVFSSYGQRFGADEASATPKQSWGDLSIAGLQPSTKPAPTSAQKRPLQNWADLTATPTVEKKAKKPPMSWNDMAGSKRKKEPRQQAFAEIEFEEDESDEGDAAHIFLEWNQGEAQALLGWVEDAASRIGTKDIPGSPLNAAYKVGDYVEQLKAIPEKILEHFGLGEAVDKLSKMTKVPRNIRAILERMKEAVTTVSEFHEKQSGVGGDSSRGS